MSRWWGWLVAAVMGLVLVLVTRQRSGSFWKAWFDEARRIDIEKQTAVVQKQRGAEEARAFLDAKFQTELETLSQAEKEKADALRKDPQELARWLVRLGAERHRPGGSRPVRQPHHQGR